jgi:hypothetical protein
VTPAAEVAVDVLLLLRRGRVAPALLQLERLPALINDDLLEAVADAYEQGQLDLARQIKGDAKPRRPPARREAPGGPCRGDPPSAGAGHWRGPVGAARLRTAVTA